MITGKLPHAAGVTLLNTPLPDDALTMGEWLRDEDYRTAAIGKMHFNSGSTHGFAVRFDTPDWEAHLRAHPPRRGDRRRIWRPFVDPAAVWLNAHVTSAGLPDEAMQSSYFVDRALDFLRDRGDRPFALIVSFHDPHSPFAFPRRWHPRFAPLNFPAPTITDADRREQPMVFASLTDDEFRGIQAAYYTSLSFVDAQIGRLVRGLDSMKLSNRTLVVYVGDNGYMLGQHGRFEKHCLFEPAVRIPMIFRWPGTIPGGRRVGEMVEMVDVLPTILSLLRLPSPPGLQGIDLEPLIQDRPATVGRDAVFCEYLENEEAMIRTPRYKLIVGTGRRLRQDGYQTANPPAGPYVRLFDEMGDPGETRDLSGEPAMRTVRDDLTRRLHQRLTTTRDGLEPVPSGLSEMRAIQWCLFPRDRAATGDRP